MFVTCMVGIIIFILHSELKYYDISDIFLKEILLFDITVIFVAALHSRIIFLL
jgi:hypothetical protein